MNMKSLLLSVPGLGALARAMAPRTGPEMRERYAADLKAARPMRLDDQPRPMRNASLLYDADGKSIGATSGSPRMMGPGAGGRGAGERIPLVTGGGGGNAAHNCAGGGGGGVDHVYPEPTVEDIAMVHGGPPPPPPLPPLRWTVASGKDAKTWWLREGAVLVKAYTRRRAAQARANVLNGAS